MVSAVLLQMELKEKNPRKRFSKNAWHTSRYYSRLREEFIFLKALRKNKKLTPRKAFCQIMNFSITKKEKACKKFREGGK
jgi:hypothetical protein